MNPVPQDSPIRQDARKRPTLDTPNPVALSSPGFQGARVGTTSATATGKNEAVAPA
jgi:hypothetical protein